MEKHTKKSSRAGKASRAAEKRKPGSRMRRLFDWLSMVAVCFVVALICFFSLDQIVAPPSTALSTSRSSLSDAPENSVQQVKSWVEENRSGAGSVEFVDWSPVRKLNDGGFSVRTRYLSRHESGESFSVNQVFFLDSYGNVTSVWTLAG